MDEIQTAALNAALADFTMTSVYLPKDLSRIEDSRGVYKQSDLAKEMLDYRVSIFYKGKLLIETEYHIGNGHIPKPRDVNYATIDGWNWLKHVFKTGLIPMGRLMVGGTPVVQPELKDVMFSLVRDSDAVQYDTYEQWASDMGYDEDSRAGEKVYNACREIGIKLLVTLGAKLQELQDAYQDY